MKEKAVVLTSDSNLFSSIRITSKAIKDFVKTSGKIDVPVFNKDGELIGYADFYEEDVEGTKNRLVANIYRIDLYEISNKRKYECEIIFYDTDRPQYGFYIVSLHERITE